MRNTNQRPLHASPCVGVCTATALGDPICKGCGRTEDEVIKWNSLSNEEKITINQRLLNKPNLSWDEYNS